NSRASPGCSRWRRSWRAPGSGVANFASSILDREHECLACRNDDWNKTGELVIERFVAGIDQQRPRLQRQQLFRRGHDHDVLPTHSGDHPWHELLVAAPEQEALSADDADDDPRRLIADKRQNLLLAQVVRNTVAAAGRSHGERRATAANGSLDALH